MTHTEILTYLGLATAAFLGSASVLGLIAKYVLLPWLKEQFGSVSKEFVAEVTTSLTRLEAGQVRVTRDVERLSNCFLSEHRDRSVTDRQLQDHQDFERKRLDDLDAQVATLITQMAVLLEKTA